MRNLTIALYAEGSTDYRFLPILIQRTAEKILCENHSPDVSVLEPLPIDKNISGETGADKILEAAKVASGVDLLIIHSDSDTRTLERARVERFEPGKKLVEENPADICKCLLPIIPVKNIEAWLLADIDAFQRVVGTRLTEQQLNIPVHQHQVESVPDPKQVYRDAVRIALTERRKRGNINTGAYYEPLGRELNLGKLLLVPGFYAFYQEFLSFLAKLRYINLE
ncbi:DUF4276 family protein [Paenibacillus sp. TRM 82003]|nr:DUF4276 family protein [Paenibacillus sp. TRM 82003]